MRRYEDGVLKGYIKVKVKPELVVSPQGLKAQSSDGIARVGIMAIDQLNEDHHAVRMERVFPYSPQFESRHQKHGLHLWYRIELDHSRDVREVVKTYGAIQEVEIAEPYYEKRLIPYTITKMDEATSVALKSAAATFNDPMLGDQWHYHNTGQTGGVPGADINLNKAWDIQTGNPNVIVSIHDQGIDVEHEDLAANMWVNEAELNGEPGVDDDGNGYVDDVYGYNFADNTGGVTAMDHGTHVGGTVSAVNNNGIGVAGVAGGTGNNDGVRLMSCQIMSASAGGMIEASFIYAADMGAVISQNSWGWSQDGAYEQSVLDAIDYFIEEAGQYPGSPMKGGVAIFAAGNTGIDGKHYPAYYESTIAVGATGPGDLLTDYSNFGTYLDITAPGGDNRFGNENGVLSTVPGDYYGYMDGTSMACPHVSGVAALIASEHGGDTFTKDDLLTHLLTGVKVLDTIPENQPYAGKMGVGGTDAWLALQKDNGIAPDRITDFEMSGISQDFATFQWSVPADEDDGRPTSFEVCYYTSDFDDSSIDQAYKTRFENKLNPGEKVIYELQGLKPETNYTFAVRALDRWGNAASISNKVQDRTNAGPVVEVAPASFTFDIDVTVDTEATGSISLSNVGEGILKWEGASRHVKNIDTYSLSEQIRYPEIKVQSRKMPELKHMVPDVDAGGEVVPYAQKPLDDDLLYFDEFLLGQTMVTIGETDINYTNSTATRFRIQSENGFNLTHFEFALHLPELPLESPVILEVYEGEDINTARKVSVSEYEPQSAGYNFYFAKLDEQLFFEQGDVFWMVVHVPSGNLFPLIGSMAKHPDYSENCYYSNNLGSSWEKLSDVYYRNDYVWDVAAWSQYEPLHTYMKLMPDKGVVASMESTNVSVTVEADSLINGDYETKIALLTNEPGNELRYVPATIKVRGHKPALESADIVDFGNVFVGESKAMSIEIYNSGLGAFAANNNDPLEISISNPDFTLSKSAPKIIYAERGEVLTFRYWPTNAGASNALVTLTDKHGQTHQFNLFAVGVNPAVATIDPPENDFTGLSLGDVVNGSFNLRNDGEYPLQYYIPRFADGSNLNGDTKGLVHQFGYVGGQVEGDATTPAFDWVDISTTGTEVGSEFLSNSTVIYVGVPIGFEFPFFDSKEDTVYITTQGVLSFDNTGWFNSTPVMFRNVTQPDKLVSAYGLPIDLTKGGNIYYQRFPGKFVVQYHQTEHIYLDLSTFTVKKAYISFQIVLFDNGDVEIYYKDLGDIPAETTVMGERSTMLVAIYDEKLDDGIKLNGITQGGYTDWRYKTDMPPTTGYMMYFRNPGMGAVKSVTNPYGTVQVGQSVQIDYTVDTKDLFVSDFTERINVISNDPAHNPAIHHINLNITSGGEAVYDFSEDTVLFGDVFQRGEVTKKLVVTNTGKAFGTIADIHFKNGYYSYEGYMPVDLKPGTRVDYDITINSQEMGNKDDVMVLTDALGQTHEVILEANVVEAPIISVQPGNITETLNYGESRVVQLTVNNTGKNPMQVTPISNEWLQVLQSGHAGNSKDVEYHVTFTDDPSSIYNSWIDITETGEKLPVGDAFDKNKFWRTKKLPFNFPYYGNQYDTLFIGFNGILTFMAGLEAFPFGPDAEIPHVDEPNDFIAPMWGPMGPDWVEIYPNAGTYYQEYEDKVVIMFREYMNLFSMGYPISFEAVLYKNGFIKFMYHFPMEEITTKWSVVGIENADGTKGHAVSYFVHGLVKDGSVITFSPVEEYEVAANSSMSFDATLNAKSVFGGVYEEMLEFTNNTPDAPAYSIPVSMTVVGDKTIETSDMLDLGEVFIYQEELDNAMQPKVYDFNFTLRNRGTEKIRIDRVMLKQRSTGLTIMGDQEKFGTPGAEDPWVDISRKLLNYDLKPVNSETFNLRVKPLAPAEIVDTVMVYCDVEGGLFKIPVSAKYTNPPVVGIQPGNLEIYTNTSDEVVNRTVTLDNSQGEATLSYAIEIEFERSAIPEPTVNQLEETSVENHAEIAAAAINNSWLKSAKGNSMNREDYNRILEHDDTEVADGLLGFGGGYNFFSGTAFKAPDNGFNLTHVMTWYNWAGELTTKMEVQIYGGSEDLKTADLIYSQLYDYDAEEATDFGALITLELDENLLFYPNETFFVVFKYAKVAAYPQGSIEVTEEVANRYYYGNGEQFFELVDQGYGDTGWLVKAAEKSYESNIWAILTSDKEGIVEAGMQKELDLTFIAEYAEQGINVASMNVHSNDPITPLAEMPITLTRNKGPQFTDGDRIYYSMWEADTLRHTVVAYDEEGDSFTLELKQEYDYLTVDNRGDEMDLVFAPDYDGAGIHLIEVVGRDSYGNESSFIMDVAVENVNRAPVEDKEIGNQYYILETEEGYVMDLQEFIVDPDGDELVFAIEWNDAEVVDVFQSGSGLIMMPMGLGSGNMKIHAMDSYGARLETGFVIFVDHRTGIDEGETNAIELYPNPVYEVLNIRSKTDGQEPCQVRITNSAGEQLIWLNREFLGGQISLDVSDLTAGFYFIELMMPDGERITHKFTKR
jgi:subtilisin family serine protease